MREGHKGQRYSVKIIVLKDKLIFLKCAIMLGEAVFLRIMTVQTVLLSIHPVAALRGQY